MEVTKTTFVLFFILINLTNYCHCFWPVDFVRGLVTSLTPASKADISSVVMLPGDVIWCRIGTPRLANWSPFWHSMLATSAHTVIHVNAMEETPADAVIEEVDTSVLSGRLQYKGTLHCENWGAGMLGRKKSVKMARKFVNQKIYYDMFMCNSQHWVHFWANGYPYSFNSGMSVDEECQKFMFPRKASQ